MKRMFVLAILMCAICGAQLKLEPASAEVRKHALRRAQVWTATDVARMDILRGPQNEIVNEPEQLVECQYVEPEKPLAGVAPKFICKHKSGQILRVKYGEENKEIYSEVAATRLYWALGFYADEVYPVQLKCFNCPENPFKSPSDSPRATMIFKDAVVELPFRGSPIEEKEDQGWKWSELQKVDRKEGGASRTELDALRLLTVFVQDADTKADNQRLACYREQIDFSKNDCTQPVLMVQDLGATFGSGFTGFRISKMDFDSWQDAEIWNTKAEAKKLGEIGKPVCIAKITSSNLAGDEGLNDPVISEQGRAFLAQLLGQLTDRQIYDLFRVSRAERLKRVLGEEKEGTVEDWVAAFKQKRKEIQDRRCGDDSEVKYD